MTGASGYAFLAAVHIISTRVSADPSSTSTVARAGGFLRSTYAIHAASIFGFDFMSLTYTAAVRMQRGLRIAAIAA